MTIYGLMCLKDEVGRYLESAINNALDVVDELFVFDDRSTDGSAGMALDLGATVAVRLESEPSFLEHEGRFRQCAWDTFTSTLLPKVGDWVVAIDADECLVTKNGSTVRPAVDAVIKAASNCGCTSVLIPVPEVFGRDEDGTPLVRVDGLWGTIRGTRLFAYQPGGVFADKAMACGSEPCYVQAGSKYDSTTLLLAHFGYCDREDQRSKYERYTALLDHGHNNRHVLSIMASPTLRRWPYGPVPTMERAVPAVAA